MTDRPRLISPPPEDGDAVGGVLRRRLPTALTSSSRRARWRRSKLRRLLCAFLTALGVWLIGSAVMPAGAGTGEPVVVAARAVPLGATVSADDLRLERRPASQRPAEALAAVEPVVGQVAAGPLAEGEPLTPARFQGPHQLAGMPPGQVAVSVPLVESGLVATLRPADTVEVLAAGSGETVAARALVLSVARPDPSLLGASDAGGHVVLAVTSDEARRVAAAMAAQAGPSGFVLALRGA